MTIIITTSITMTMTITITITMTITITITIAITIIGYSFPRVRGGPMCYADHLGLPKLKVPQP
jgi:hypothetical protein